MLNVRFHDQLIFRILTHSAAGREAPVKHANLAEKKIWNMQRFANVMEMLRSIIDHKKVFVLALNGPAIGAGAAWFTGSADIMLAASGAYLQIPFSALGLVPENGSATIMAQSLGVHRANDILMFGRQVTVEEMESAGLVNRIFPKEGFHDAVVKFLQEQLDVNDGKSMMEMKRLQNAPLRDSRMIAVYNSIEALAERFVEVCLLFRLVRVVLTVLLQDAPVKRFEESTSSTVHVHKENAKIPLLTLP
jgi:peroxisomal 3,2-trans-enoyl-CoA isomerase